MSLIDISDRFRRPTGPLVSAAIILLVAGLVGVPLASGAPGDQGLVQRNIIPGIPTPPTIPLTIAQAESATGFEAGLQITNLSATEADVTLRFRDNAGSPLEVLDVPVTTPGTESAGLTVRTSEAVVTLPGWGTVESRVVFAASDEAGWIEIRPEPDLPITAAAMLTWAVPEGTSSAVEVGAARAYRQAWLVADDREGRSTTLHLVNFDAEGERDVHIRSWAGEEGCEAEVTLAAHGTAVVTLAEELPCSADSLGPIEILGLGSFAGLGRISLGADGPVISRALAGLENPKRQALPLEAWIVSNGGVQFEYEQSDECIDLQDRMLVATTYVVHSSGWQRRDDEDGEWEYVPGTNRSGQLCAYTPTEPGEYRAVADVTINGVRGLHASLGTVQFVAPVEPTPPGPTDPGTPTLAEFQSELTGTFVELPAGEFVMGSTGEEADADEQPLTTVQITEGFQIGKYEITLDQWELVMGTNVYSNDECGRDCPVVTVAFSDVEKYLDRLNQRDPAYTYRLPTEAEWEYAARAGESGERYGELDAIAWYSENSDPSGSPIGQKQPNAWGLYDTLGSVREWVQDLYGTYPGGTVSDPTGPTEGTLRVSRGGSFLKVAAESRFAARSPTPAGSRLFDLGVRLVRTPNGP